MPKLKSEIDITNFDVEFTNCSIESSYEKSPGEEDNSKFKDFSFE